MNYRQKIRRAIECPQFGDASYGEWGALNLEQRKFIKRLLDELDRANNCIKKLYLENKKQKEIIDKVVLELVNIDGNLSNSQLSDRICNLIDILKEVSDE